MPKVSVIVPNFNHAHFLPQRLESILAQTCTDYELIVLDDFSSDNSRDVLERYAKQIPMRLIFNEKNSGSPFKQWRKGAALASGEYLWIAESDDYSDPYFLEKLVRRLDENPNVGIAYCDSQVVDENGQTLGRSREWNSRLDERRWEGDFMSFGASECVNYLSQQNTIPNASAVVSRCAIFLRQDGLWDEMRLCGDWLKWIQMLTVSDIVYVSEPLNYYRTHRKTVRETFGRIRQFDEECEIFMYLLKTFHENPAILRQVKASTFHKWKEVQGNIGTATSIRWYSDLAPFVWRLSPMVFFYTLFSFGLSRILHSSGLAPLRKLKQSWRDDSQNIQVS